MRIVIYTSTFLPKIGGAELVVHHLAEGLTEIGDTVHVVTFQHAPRNAEARYAIRRLGVPRGAGRVGATDLARRLRLATFVSFLRPDVIHGHFSIPCGLDLKRISPFVRVPWALTCHGEDIQKDPTIGYGYRLSPHLEDRIGEAVCGADRLVAISGDVRREYLSLGAKLEAVVDLPNPIAPVSMEESRVSARRKLDLNPDSAVVLAVGRNHPKKGFDRLLDVADELLRRDVTMQYVIVGEGVTELRDELAARNLDTIVKLFERAMPAGVSIPSESDSGEMSISTFYRAADIFAMPSRVESFGLVTAEALAAGLPVVAFDGPGTRDVIAEVQLGFLVPDGDIPAFAGSLRRLSEDPHLRRKAGEQGARFAERFDRRRIARLHHELYTQMVSSGVPARTAR